MRMQVILDSSFARPGSGPIWGGKKGEFRDRTIKPLVSETLLAQLVLTQTTTTIVVLLHNFRIGDDLEESARKSILKEIKHVLSQFPC